MTTIIVHGTFAQGSSWYWDSWGPQGFCHALGKVMEGLRGGHDIWRVRGKPVSAVPALSASHGLNTRNGVFEWSGAPDGMMRGIAAETLCQYLNALRSVTDEPIRIIAHSHGCNVVKRASSLASLDARVHINRAVFLACPHFWEQRYVFPEHQTWQDKMDIRKQMGKPSGRLYHYRASPRRFGKILNLYSARDPVQVDFARSLSGGFAPQTGSVLENIREMIRTGGLIEVPQATREDSDPDAAELYENKELPVSPSCKGTDVHTVMHGAEAATLAARWLCEGDHIDTLLAGHEPSEIAPNDTGA